MVKILFHVEVFNLRKNKKKSLDCIIAIVLKKIMKNKHYLSVKKFDLTFNLVLTSTQKFLINTLYYLKSKFKIFTLEILKLCYKKILIT
jgi:hypothetical protein